MVNNNNLPLIEEVRELKNEIPSYEEFMKNWKEDENLNYDDLNSGDIGTQKGYGPGLFGDIVNGEAGKHLTDVATAAAVNTASVVLVPAIAGNNVEKAVKTVAKKFA